MPLSIQSPSLRWGSAYGLSWRSWPTFTCGAMNFPKTWYTRLSPRWHQPRLLKAKKTDFPPPKAEELPAANLCPRVTSLHGPFMQITSIWPQALKLLRFHNLFLNWRCHSVHQICRMNIYTSETQKCLPSFSLLLPPPLSLFLFLITSLTGTLQCALLLSSAIYSQVISSVFPPPTSPLRAKQCGHYSQPALPPPCISHLFIPPKSRGSYFPTCSKPCDTL